MRIVVLSGLLLLLAVALNAHSEGGKTMALPAPGSADWKKMAAGYKAGIEPILSAKCMDCHSANTSYPWYYRIPGVKQMIDKDIRKGRRIIDLTGGFPFKGLGTAQERIEGLHHAIADGSMPPLMYRMMHWGSGITDEERELILDWINRE